uniref:uncharacterized protein LOC120334215 n=1 Tax=Styela clava TaxID=7725 RepID=UPI0019393A75|nr:uncharacterized protein LOC120334215 [Styela clava]
MTMGSYEEYMRAKRNRETIGSETVLLWGLRLWQIVAMVLTGLIIITVGFCCVCKCRIPRKMKEIEADHEKRQTYKKQKMMRVSLSNNGATQSTSVIDEAETERFVKSKPENIAKSSPAPIPKPRNGNLTSGTENGSIVKAPSSSIICETSSLSSSHGDL